LDFRDLKSGGLRISKPESPKLANARLYHREWFHMSHYHGKPVLYSPRANPPMLTSKLAMYLLRYSVGKVRIISDLGVELSV
jgi:hypothetical protein